MLYFKILITFLIFSSIASSKELVDRIVATVSNEVVLQSELDHFPDRIDKMGSIDETLLFGERAASLKGNKAAQLDFLVREKILESEIKRLGLTISDAQVESEMTQMAKRGNMDFNAFSNYLVQQGYTVDEYKKILRNRIERQNFFEREIISKLRITDDDALSVYQNQNPNSRTSISEFKIAQIFFSTRKSGSEQALARATAAYERFRNGDSFETLANQLDETPGSNADGVLGTFKTGEFIPEIEKEIASLNDGQVSRVTQGPNGFHIVKLLTKKSIPDPQFLKVKESIKS
ncbi:MAG: peptidylprolyl isomerase, partial [Bdellovibrionaceae bacterium]|nr:peptidylprolyl isomerase [Pseudobdellovibrionaceae bacterium]